MQSNRDRVITPAQAFRLGFSPLGCVAVLLPMIPNVLWVLLPPVFSPLTADTPFPPWVHVIGLVCQSVMIALLILVINTRRRSTPGTAVVGLIGALALLGYLVLWVLYFLTPITPTILVMMAILPSVYFLCVGLYLQNYPSLVPAALFASIHISDTAMSYL
ncbi:MULTISPECIES: hypothetical protein [unclassified Dietzia]|uniref:hypothetical protein n=1 Tax=unclassified Dietzia TaxID=2617939 RepID=UPI000D20AD2E|nr:MULTISPECIES: hypothetical protein [unclassified Dietzia]AVZ39890.1 hypothetical protein CT688_10915 [Dietzia sp. JS16-p6b]